MDGEKYRHFLSLVDGVIHRVGARNVFDVIFSGGNGTVAVAPEAFEQLSGQRQVSQQLTGSGNHRSFSVGGHEVKTVYSIQQPRTVRQQHGEYIDLCCEILDEEIATILSEQTVVAAEAVSDG